MPSTCYEITRILWNPKVHNSPPLVPSQSHLNRQTDSYEQRYTVLTQLTDVL